jgi:hypothetical protein
MEKEPLRAPGQTFSGIREEITTSLVTGINNSSDLRSLISVPIPGGISVRDRKSFVQEIKNNLDLLDKTSLEEIQIYLDLLLEK